MIGRRRDLLQPARGAAVAPPPEGAAFWPQGRLPPLIFLHIPKTSGSSANEILRGLYGPRNFVEHFEYVLAAPGGAPAALRRVDCLSGHLSLCFWPAAKGTAAYTPATILREPWSRLVSHINWVARHAPGGAAAAEPASEQTLRAAALVVATDFSSRASILALRRACNAIGMFNAFDNLQVRMLLTARPRAAYAPLQAGDALRAFANLERFGVVGFSDRQADFVAAVARHAGLAVPAAAAPVRANVTRAEARVLEEGNDLAREVLLPWHMRDLNLWRRARARFG